MEPQKQIIIFLSEFDYQVEQIESVYEKLEKKVKAFDKKSVTEEAVESTAYWLHNLYCACEDLFKLVAGFWENSLSVNGDFHVNLLKRMLLSIEKVRPPLISESSYKLLNELRGFRHVFRHAYSYGLDVERVGSLLQKYMGQKDTLKRDFSAFRKSVASYIEE